MDRASLTTEYLSRVTENGAKAADLIGRLPESEMLRAFYKATYLSRPVFLGHAERVQAFGDVSTIMGALSRLPDLLFGGDFAAFARATGLTEPQVAAAVRGRGAAMTRQARADLFVQDNQFKLLELNIGSSIGGMDNADICRGLLEHPLLAEFAADRNLGYVDTLREQVNNVLVESGFQPGDRPVVALTDWPANFDNEVAYMRLLCERWRGIGLEAHPCHVGQLQVRDGRVWLEDKPVDIVFRTFTISQIVDRPELFDPVLNAAERGEVKIFTPLDTAAYASKGALAMLSDEENRGLFSAEELASVDRLLPWTRMVRPGQVTLEGGERVDLLQHAVDNRHELVLKPTSLYGNRGVVLGWTAGLTAEEWREQVVAAFDAPFVLQRRVRPTAELFPDENGDLQPWNVLWGMFSVVNGYGGANTRAIKAEWGDVVMNRAHGIHSGPALSELCAPDA
ncbi:MULTISPECIES: hypothetical protein [unclassified Streptomyces]|jgi:hypothetical protein|uniref:hypothetical protein n=1 Tax=unclassified Streptomyces TaxID=2593676 RepID=UPI00081B0CA3|nr:MULTISPECIES: hypothetical protein [unclassified Streptomyces]MYQ88539.1 hypothetical protein [Streptomyces sp. SID4936]SCE55796.1 hypothetical protein GA0115234_111856 [Streptomyces sp. DvalAA-43]